MNEAKLREYAKLIVKIGANVQKGQRVRLQTGVDQDKGRRPELFRIHPPK